MSTPVEKTARQPVPAQTHVVVVGAGFAGLYMMYRLQKLGINAMAFEAGTDVGGTWFWNRYPGARCDVESLEYSYSFSDEVQQAWRWNERYAAQPEILSYINHVADTFDLRRHIHFNTRVAGAEFDPATGLWSVTTEHGDIVTARFCVMATGCLSEAAIPKISGLDRFEGKVYHTGQWPKDAVDFSGQRVGVIGTGSSGIQVITQVAKQAAHLHVFQRTANYSLPAHNRPMDPEVERRTKDRYAELRESARRSQSGVASFGLPEKSVHEVSDEECRRTLQERWDSGGLGFTRAYNDVLMNEESNRVVAEFVREKIRGLVRDPKVAEMLTPTYLIGTKRLCADTGYFETYNRDNVTLVDIKSDPIVEITESGVRTGKGAYAIDALILATGFDAITGALLRMNIHSKDGTTLRQLWEHGPRTFMGLMTAGLPNLFFITGPGSPSVLSNVVVSVEQHVEWICDCIHWLDTHGVARMEADPKAQVDWVAHVNEVANQSLFPRGESWYAGANIPGKPRVFTPYIGGVGTYRKLCEDVAASDYKPFVLSGTTTRSRQ